MEWRQEEVNMIKKLMTAMVAIAMTVGLIGSLSSTTGRKLVTQLKKL